MSRALANIINESFLLINATSLVNEQQRGSRKLLMGHWVLFTINASFRAVIIIILLLSNDSESWRNTPRGCNQYWCQRCCTRSFWNFELRWTMNKREKEANWKTYYTKKTAEEEERLCRKKKGGEVIDYRWLEETLSSSSSDISSWQQWMKRMEQT